MKTFYTKGPFTFFFRINPPPLNTDKSSRNMTHFFVCQFQPLFLFVSMQAPHTPLQVDNKYKQLYRGINMGNRKRKTIAGMISCMDEAIGDITEALTDYGLYNDSVILFSSGNY